MVSAPNEAAVTCERAAPRSDPPRDWQQVPLRRLGVIRRSDPRPARARAARASVLAIGLPLHHWTRATSELLLAALVGFAAIRLRRLVGGTPRMLMSGAGPLTQLGAVAGGFVLGLGAYLLGAPAILPAGANPSRW